MSRRLPVLAVLVALAQPAGLFAAEAPPKGDVTKYTFDRSEVFPGTVRDYWVYVPKQYDPGKPACVYVNQDGLQYNAPAVFDELIDRKEMPVTIGVFVMHGKVKAPPTGRSTASTGATSTTASATPTPASSSTSCSPRSRRRPPPTAGRSGSRTTATTAASPAPAAAPSAPSPRPGSGPTPSPASSARSAPTSASAAPTSTRRSSASSSPSRSASSSRTAAPT